MPFARAADRYPHADIPVDTQDRTLQFRLDADAQYVNLCPDSVHVPDSDGDDIEIVRRADHVRSPGVRRPVVRGGCGAEGPSLAEVVP